MKKIKVMTVVGTRPEIIRLSRIISLLNEETSHVLVHTGQNYDYELNEIFFNELNIPKPNYFLNSASDRLANTIGNIISNIDPIFEKESPDALLVLGDTNSSLVSIIAKRRKIPIFHMEAGNRCFDYRVPEEINRKIVDHISDINLTYSNIARGYLIEENIPPDRIITVGSPMFEVLSFYEKSINNSDILSKMNLVSRNYFVASFHREENINSNNINVIIDVLNEICSLYDKEIIVTTHPRTKKMLDKLNLFVDKRIRFCKPFGFFDYVHLQKHAMVVLSDSGTISEESSILGFPALNIRTSHERPEAMEEGAVIMTGMNKNIILNSIQIMISQTNKNVKIVNDYNVDNVSQKVLRIIVSYIDYVNNVVWKKGD